MERTGEELEKDKDDWKTTMKGRENYIGLVWRKGD